MVKTDPYFTKRTRWAAAFLVLALIAACSSPAAQGEDEAAFQSAVDTAVAETDTAQAAEAQLTQLAMTAFAPTETTAPSSTPEPSLTLTPESTPEEASPTSQDLDFSLSGPAVQVSVDTNCRSGPGKNYTWLGGLLVGEEAQIVGKDPSGLYWYITNPDREGEYCWIWGGYAITSGNTAPLPVFTPGPTPTPEPNFSTDLHEIEFCGGFWQVEFTIVNNGLVSLESVSSYVKDTVTANKSAESSVNYFQNKTGCTVTTSQDQRSPGQTGYTVSLDLANDPTGHLTFASITVCTQDSLLGDCRTREFYFTP